MKLSIKSEVTIPGIGTCTHEHTQDFDDSSNVFGRVYDYRQYMKDTFPGCKYRLLSAKEVR